MKKLNHLFVTRYELHVTSYTLRVERFKHFTSHLTPLTSYLIPLTFFLFLPAAALAQATVTNVDFSCPGIVTVEYNLLSTKPEDVTLEYSSDKCKWFEALTETDVAPGNGLTLSWNAAAAGVSYGKFYYRVIYQQEKTCAQKGGVEINSLCWAKTNLDVNGEFCEYPWNKGALYQWGRKADGHENITSGTVNTQSTTPIPGHGNFIIGNNNWLNPSNDNLWDSGTTPIKTIYDPCPEGWRVPTKTELEDLGSTRMNHPGPLETYPSSTTVGRWFGNGGVPSLFLPAAGTRNQNSGVVNYDGQSGYYWCSATSVTSVTTAINLYFGINTFLVYNGVQALGCNIRCVAEE